MVPMSFLQAEITVIYTSTNNVSLAVDSTHTLANMEAMEGWATPPFLLFLPRPFLALGPSGGRVQQVMEYHCYQTILYITTKILIFDKETMLYISRK